MEKHSTIGEITNNKVIDDDDMIAVNETMNEDICDNLSDSNVFRTSEPIAIMDTTNPGDDSNEDNVIKVNHETYLRINERSYLSSIANQSKNSEKDYSSAIEQPDCSITRDSERPSLSGTVDSLESSTDRISSTSTNNLTDKTTTLNASRYNDINNEENEHSTDTNMTNSEKFDCDELENPKDNDNETTSKSLVRNGANGNLNNSCINIEPDFRECEDIQEKSKKTYKGIKEPNNDCKELVEKSNEINEVIEEPISSSHQIIAESMSTNEENCEIIEDNDKENGSNEVFQIDQTDEDDDMMVGTNDKDPFEQENELTSIDSDVPSNDKVMKITEIMEVDQNQEVDESNKGASSEDNIVQCASENIGITVSDNVGADRKVVNKEVEIATCIIPESSVNNEIADKCDNLNKPRKFDITPVRLEKLMDPSKLISTTSANSQPVNPADENKNIVNIGRPRREAARKAESQIKEIVNEGNENLPKDFTEKNTICCRCSRFRVCKWVGPGLDKYACVEYCHRFSSEVKPKTTASLQAIALHPLNVSKVQSNGQQRSPLQFPSQTQQKPILSLPDSIHYLRRCGSCGLHDIVEDKCLSWEAMDFCNEKCLSHYQNDKGSNCSFCKKVVLPTNMGKYAVRFGLEARQFCSGHCLEEFKKGLKSCSYCQKDISKVPNIVHLPAIGEKQQTKEFCSNACRECYECLSANLPLPVIRDVCTVCNIKKLLEYQVLVDGTTHSLCSDLCFNAFNFANNITETDQCTICRKFYEENSPDSYFVFHDDAPYTLCSKICMNVFILFRRKIVPCSWCKVKKYNFDMIKRSTTTDLIYVCSINCLALYQVSINAPVSRKIPCESCKILSTAQYHLTMSDASIRNFCSYNCVMSHQTQYSKNTVAVIDTKKSNIISSPVPLGAPRRVLTTQTVQLKGVNVSDNQRGTIIQKSNVISNGLLPQISSTSSALRITSPITLSNNTAASIPPVISTSSSIHVQPKTKYVQQLIVMPPEPKEVTNKNTQCRPCNTTKAVSCKPIERTVETQTDEVLKYPVIVPIPVPIYVPVPLHMYTTPYPVPVPFSVPIPVPIFIPTTQKTFKGLTSKIKQILDKIPSNPYEADLLLMAEMVGNGNKTTDEVNVNDLNSHFPESELDVSESETNSTEDTESNPSSQGVAQMLKVASEQSNNSPSVDLEAELTSNTITAQGKNEESEKSTKSFESVVERPRTRKRTQTATAVSVAEAPSRKRRAKQHTPLASTSVDAEDSNSFQISSRRTDAESPLTPEKNRPDAAMCLKYTIGVRGWKQWVIQKNEQIEKTAAAAAAGKSKKPKTFNVNILKLTTDELNYLLCKFVHEVRKPNGTEYAPDTIYYLCLSIQQYLFENGRVDNIFTDTTYEPFTAALDEVAKKFSEINDSTQFILTRVEEEHLWESKQLGAHSPHVLLATLMFFNTKYFNLATLEEHMQLSFSHILKHWKRNSSASSCKPGSPSPNRNVVLRFYPPQSALDAPNSRKKKLYEQHENEVNPLRCPVKLYEFYLSKCPESVKQRNDVFYLQPERSCVPDSPVWYSTMPYQKEFLMKILHRIRIVKEVNISLLAS